MTVLPLFGFLLLAVCAVHANDPLLPPGSGVFTGVVMGATVTDFERRTGKHPAVVENFVEWGLDPSWAFERASLAKSRLMLAVNLDGGQNQPEVISPQQIAMGHGDAYLIRLNSLIHQTGAPAYLRLMGECNNCNNPYAPTDCEGASRGASHSTTAFIHAWRRSHLILTGGSLENINHHLRTLGLPPVLGRTTDLPAIRVAFVWSPMTHGSPDVPELMPEHFWPGSEYVEWVGTSFYSKYPEFAWLETFYQDFAVHYKKPMVFAEWALWGEDDPSFVRELFAFIHSHPRVRMEMYNQGDETNGVFRLVHYPQSAAAMKAALASSKFVATAPTVPAHTTASHVAPTTHHTAQPVAHDVADESTSSTTGTASSSGLSTLTVVLIVCVAVLAVLVLGLAIAAVVVYRST